MWGGAGNDLIDGGNGDDTVAGEGGDDVMVGENGVDSLTGGPGGDDSAHGGQGDDTCAAETVVSCETEVPDQGGDLMSPDVALLFPEDGALVGETITLEVSATDNTAVATVEFVVDGVVIGSDSTPSGTTYSLEATFDLPGEHWIAARAIDSAGNVGVSPVATVTVPAEALPSSYVVFTDPQPMAAVFSVLATEALHPLEFEHVVSGDEGQLTGGGFYAPDAPLADQEAYYRVLHQDRHEVDPLIVTVRLSGVHDASALAALADEVERVEPIAALTGDNDNPSGIQGQSAQAGGGSGTLTAVEREDWWPDRGTVFAFDSEVTFPVLPPCISLFFCPPAGTLVQPTRDIVQEFGWDDQEALDLLTSGLAYEHDFKLFNDDLDPMQKRPFCGFSFDDFWSSRVMIWWDADIPFSARPYLDTGVEDECTVSDFTIGILLPASLEAGFFRTEIRTLPGDLDESPYRLQAQQLGKTGGVLCRSKWCVNILGSIDPVLQALIPTERPDGTERTAPIECTGWRVLDTVANPAPMPVIDENACSG